AGGCREERYPPRRLTVAGKPVAERAEPAPSPDCRQEKGDSAVTNFKFSRDLLGGLVVTGVGAAFLAGSLGMRIGSGTNMGPGFFPFACSIITLLLGFWIAAEGLRNHVVIETPEWRQALAILAAISVFAVMLEAFGLIPAVITGSL